MLCMSHPFYQPPTNLSEGNVYRDPPAPPTQAPLDMGLHYTGIPRPRPRPFPPDLFIGVLLGTRWRETRSPASSWIRTCVSKRETYSFNKVTVHFQNQCQQKEDSNRDHLYFLLIFYKNGVGVFMSLTIFKTDNNFSQYSDLD